MDKTATLTERKEENEREFYFLLWDEMDAIYAREPQNNIQQLPAEEQPND